MADTPAEMPSGWEHGQEQAGEELANALRERAERLLEASSGLLLWGAAHLDLLRQRMKEHRHKGFEVPDRQAVLAPPDPTDAPRHLPVKAERPDPPSDKLIFTWDYNFMHQVMVHADSQGQSINDFMMSAFDFEMTWRSFRGHNAIDEELDRSSTMIVGVPRLIGGDRTSRLSAYDIEQRFMSPYEQMRGAQETSITIDFNEEQVASMMMAIAFSVEGERAADMEQMADRQTQLNLIGTFTRRSLTHYMAKIDAEAAGWDIMLDQNLGDGMMIPLDSLRPGGSDAEA